MGLCLLVGAANGAVTATSVRTWYLSLTPPPGTPPNWIFGPVWTSLNILAGVAAWLIWRHPDHRRALLLWGWQLLANAVWSPAFFAIHSPRLALAVLVVLLALTAATIRAFARVRPAAARLMVPYLLWTCYATYLNVGFWWLNPA